jgi:hypothetical protein
VEAEFETKFVTAGSLLYAVEHRPWMPPDGQWLLSESWNDMLLAHFPIAPPVLRRLVPEAMTLDLYDGTAWLTISPLCITHMRPSGVPPMPGLSYFPRVNVRTCVTMKGERGEDKPGLYYFSVDAANLSAVWFARIWFRMEYWHAKIKMSGATVAARRPEGSSVFFISGRLHGPKAAGGAARLELAYTPEGSPAPARRGSLDEFLNERYCVYSEHRGKCYRIEMHHQPWLLQPARVQMGANSLGAPLGLELPAEPALCHFSRAQKMLVWAPERVKG